MAVDTHPSMPASPRLATTVSGVLLADGDMARSTSRTELEEPTNSVASEGSSARTVAAMASPLGHDCSMTDRAALSMSAPASAHSRAHCSSTCRLSGMEAVTAANGWTTDATCEGSAQMVCAATISTVTAEWRMRAPTALESVIRPTTRTCLLYT